MLSGKKNTRRQKTPLQKQKQKKKAKRQNKTFLRNVSSVYIKTTSNEKINK